MGRWVTINGVHRWIKDEDDKTEENYSNRTTDKYDSKFGTKDKRSGIEYATEEEMIEARKEKQIEEEKEIAKNLNAAEKEMDKEKKAASASAKRTRRKAIKVKNGTITDDEGTYKVEGTETKSGKEIGYYAKDSKGQRYHIDRFGKKRKL